MKNAFVSLSMLIVAAVMASGCVLSPKDGDFVSRVINFRGYGLLASDEITITAYNKHTRVWDELGTATTSASPFHINGTDLYSWRATVDLRTNPNYECYWTAGCRFPAEGVYDSQFRVLERGRFLTTFGVDGDQCIGQGLQDGDSPITIGRDCASENNPVLNLKAGVVW